MYRMNGKSYAFFIALVLLAGVPRTRAQQIEITGFRNGVLMWSGAALGATCRVQQADSLTGNNWTDFQLVLVTNNSMSMVVPMVSGSSSTLFYRVVGVAAPRISLTSTSGAPGSADIVSGQGYQAGESVTVTYNGAVVASSAANSAENFSVAFTVPTNNPPGTYPVTVTGQTSQLSATAPFDQNQALVVLSPPTGPPGSMITIHGYGFAAGELVNVTYNSSPIASFIADATGSGSVTVIVPSNATGAYPVTVAGQTSLVNGTAYFSQSLATLTPGSGAPGSSTTVNFYRYAPSETVDIYYSSNLVDTVTADVSGNGNAMITIPFNTAGVYSVTVTGLTSQVSQAVPFSQTLATLTPGTGAPGSTTTVNFYRYAPSETVDIYYSSNLVDTVTADVSGNGNAMITIPFNTAGVYSVTVTGLTSRVSQAVPFSQTLATLTPGTGAPGSTTTVN